MQPAPKYIKSSIITEQELMDATGYKKRAHLEKYLRKVKLHFHFGKQGKIWTTVDALNASLGLDKKQAVNGEDDFK